MSPHSWRRHLTRHKTPPATRTKVLELVLRRPGLSIRQIADTVGTTWANAKYHIVVLEHEGAIGTTVVGRRRVCFSRTTPTADVIAARVLIAETTARRIAVTIVEHPGIHLTELLHVTGMTQRVVYYHLKRLIDAGLVEHAIEARYKGLVPTNLLCAALE